MSQLEDLTPEKIKIIQKAYSNRFKYYGDEWLIMHDVFSKFNLAEIMQFQYYAQTNLLPPLELPYLNGAKLAMLAQSAYINAINRVVSNDKTGKYKKLLHERGKLVALDELNKKDNSMSSSMFQ